MGIHNFKIGDRVASNDPDSISYSWHGTIRSFHKDNPDKICWVDWDERKVKDIRGRRVYQQSWITHELKALRLISLRG